MEKLNGDTICPKHVDLLANFDDLFSSKHTACIKKFKIFKQKIFIQKNSRRKKILIFEKFKIFKNLKNFQKIFKKIKMFQIFFANLF